MNPKLKHNLIKFAICVVGWILFGVIYLIVNKFAESTIIKIIYIWSAIAFMIALQIVLEIFFNKRADITPTEKRNNQIVYIIVYIIVGICVFLAIGGGLTYALLT